MNVADAIDHLASQIAEAKVGRKVALVGIHSGGLPIAKRLAILLADRGLEEIVLGAVDIGLYRDDTNLANGIPRLIGSEIPYDLTEFDTILVDDVLFTGRTIRAAINQLVDYGRPAKVELAVLVDRGHREMPIVATFVGCHLETKRSEHVAVKLAELDGVDAIEVRTRSSSRRARAL